MKENIDFIMFQDLTLHLQGYRKADDIEQWEQKAMESSSKQIIYLFKINYYTKKNLPIIQYYPSFI